VRVAFYLQQIGHLITSMFAEKDVLAAIEALQTKNASKAREMQIISAADKTTLTDADTTYAANITTATGLSSNKSTSVPKKKGPKAKLTAKEKKERGVSIMLLTLADADLD